VRAEMRGVIPNRAKTGPQITCPPARVSSVPRVRMGGRALPRGCRG
jgi:hypothetical protein